METAKKQEDAAKVSVVEKLSTYSLCLSRFLDLFSSKKTFYSDRHIMEAFRNKVAFFSTLHETEMWAEIRNNIDTLKGRDRDNYIFSLLKAFGEYSNILNPVEEIKRLIDEIKVFDEKLKKLENFPLERLKKQETDFLECCIDKNINRIDGLEAKAKHFGEIMEWETYSEGKEVGAYERATSQLFNWAYRFAVKLDALLLEKGINIAWYQEQSGIYILPLKVLSLNRNGIRTLPTHDMPFLSCHFGSRKLAQKYIDEALPKTEPQQAAATPEPETQEPEQAITPEPQQGQTAPEPEQAANPQPQQSAVEAATDKDNLTERERLYYAKAIERGWAEKTEGGYKWVFIKGRGNLASLAYFLSMIFNPDGKKTEQMPFKKLERIWNVSGLNPTLNSLADRKNTQSWKIQITKLFSL